MDKTLIKGALQEHWENPKVRYGAIAVVLLTIISFIAFNTEDMNTGGAEGATVAVEKKKKVEANFFTQAGADEIDQGRMDEIYDLMEEQLAEREKAIDDREEEMRMMEGRLLQELETLKFAQNDLKRELEIQKTASDEIRKQTAPVQNTFAPPATTVAPTQQQPQQPVTSTVPMANAVETMMPRVIDRKRVGIRTINGQGDHFKDSQGNVIDQTPEHKKPKEEVVREEPQKEEPKEPVEMFLPAGSILSGVLITGMDVPTGNSVMRDPFPSILRIKEEALLPNNFTADIRECVIVASAVGDLASRRAYLRAEAISCVTEEGKAVEANLSAFAVGPDGRNGIPGRLVSKNGEAAMKSAWAGFLGGLADLAGTSSLSISDNETGAFGVFQSAEAMQTLAGSAALQGAGDAMERLADYYIEIAEQMKPYIEVNPGQSIDFIIQRGSSLRLE
ncbi:TPA: TraB/VirB10 family protein [Vibrio parahaemolyticus]|uniref:TraB/VirB10 family protein n=1 Tax=Vibrio campbellii TaxID=680 RepID=UPI001F08820D|nr:TraB/VirB10 family protein [Vibrio campbellii]UMM06596.1 TraB/VirB10 family protein [Vibrio campbellii]